MVSINRFGVLVVALLAFAATGCSGTQPAATGGGSQPAATGGNSGDQSKPKQLKKVTVVFAAGSIAPIVAGQTIGLPLGYFAEEGLEPEFQPSKGGAESQQLLATGKAEYGVLVASTYVSATAQSGDMGVVDVCNMTQKIHWQLGVRPDSTMQSIQDMKGKKIGVLAFGDSEVPGVRAALTAEGISPDKDVQIIAVGYGAQAGTALQKGDVDVLAIWDGEMAKVKDLGFQVKLLPNAPLWDTQFGFGFGVRRNYLEKNRDEVAGFCRAVAKSEIFAMANPEAAVKLHWKAAPSSRGTGPEDEALKAGLLQLKARIPNWTPCSDIKCPNFKYGWHYPDKWEATIDFLGVRDKLKSATPLFTNDLIDQINKFDVDAVVKQAKEYKS